MSTETIVKTFMQAVQNRDAESIRPLLADDVVFENMPEGSAIHGKEETYRKFSDFFGLTSKIESFMEHEVYKDDMAILERKNHICFQGKNIVLPMVTIIKVKDSKIVLFRDYFDSQTFANQLN